MAEEKNALAELADNYKFDPGEASHVAVMDKLIVLEKEKIQIEKQRAIDEPVIGKSVQRHNQKMFLIAVLALIVTISFTVWVNHLNHLDSIKLQETLRVKK